MTKIKHIVGEVIHDVEPFRVRGERREHFESENVKSSAEYNKRGN